jgi:hypothetical protein
VFSEDSAQFASQKIRFPASRPDDVSYRPDAQLSNASAFRTMCQTIWTHIKLKHHPSGRRGFSSEPSSVSRSFELLQLASVQTFQQHVRTPLGLQPATGFLSKTQIWEVRCNRPDDVESRPDALIHKASIAFKSKRPDVNPLGPDASASDMEIACIRSTVRTTIPLVRTCKAFIWKLLEWKCDRQDDRAPPSECGSNQERISAKFLESRSHSCPSGRPMTTVRTGPRFYQARHSFEPLAYK